jgi:ADP-dependent phosphofructokinase/glucokinase
VWHRRFGEALERALGRAERAQREQRLIACGFTANLDRVIAFDRETAQRLFAGQDSTVNTSALGRADTVQELLAGIAHCVTADVGCDLPVCDPAVQDWLLARVAGRVQIGGTGAQAAATLASLGFPVLLHLTGRSPAQIQALPGRERIVIGSPDGLVPVDAASDLADPTMWHVALEFEEGLSLPLPGAPAARGANRVIVSYDPVNSAFTVDPGFAAALTDPALAIETLLISGFSQVTARETMERVLWNVTVSLQVWRAVRPELTIHLELGAMPDFNQVTRTLEVLHPLVTSVGLNVDELRGVLRALGVAMAPPGPDLVAQLHSLVERFPVPRLSLHTRGFCLTLTDDDPELERDRLLFGTLAAATRSRLGTFPMADDLGATLAWSDVNAAGLALLRSLGIVEHGYGDGKLVATPGLEINPLMASVGLGDSFTGGVLAMM